MKRLLLLITICISSVSFGQYTSIPDTNFEQALIDLGHDDVIDGQVLTSNVSGLTLLNVSNKNISDLAGIEDFVGLTSMFCDNNQLNYISLSNNINLENLDFSGCPIYDLNLSENINLQALDVGGMLLLECLNLKNGNNINNNLDLSGGNNPNLNCITVDNISYAQTNWANWMDNGVSFSENCGNDCSGTSNLTELNSNQPKKLIKIVNLLGQEVEYTPNTVLIYQYSDGTSEKVFTIED
jgi:hypothetical protein